MGAETAVPTEAVPADMAAATEAATGAVTGTAATGAAMVSPTPAGTATAGAAQGAGDLSAFVGKWPFDKVNGVAWNDHPAVEAGIRKTVTDAAVRKAITRTGGPASPIALYQGKVASWSCEAHNCGDHQWNVMVDPKTGATDVCYYNAAQEKDKSRWFLPNGKTETRAGNCSVT